VISTPSRLAAAIAAILAAGAQLHAAPAVADDIDEIVVTATRRNVSLSDIPYNISAVGAADIAASGVTDLQGLTHMIPGLVAPDFGPRASNINDTLTIRGLNASSVNAESQEIAAPLVSTYVDETPLFANLKMTDIARVEVLRGPQGTLYGSGSVGGTVRMIHNEPDPTTTEFERIDERVAHRECRQPVGIDRLHRQFADQRDDGVSRFGRLREARRIHRCVEGRRSRSRTPSRCSPIPAAR
jgi:outer membrane cobalamin receptor